MIDIIQARIVIDLEKETHRKNIPPDFPARNVQEYHRLCRNRLEGFTRGYEPRTEFRGSQEEIIRAREILDMYSKRLKFELGEAENEK